MIELFLYVYNFLLFILSSISWVDTFEYFLLLTYQYIKFIYFQFEVTLIFRISDFYFLFDNIRWKIKILKRQLQIGLCL